METLLQIVSVTVRANGFIEDVLAFMETGSTTTLIAEDLVFKIGLSGPTKLVSLCLLLTDPMLLVDEAHLNSSLVMERMLTPLMESKLNQKLASIRERSKGWQ